MMRQTLILIVLFFYNTLAVIKAQDTTLLKIGDKAPSLVLPTALNTIQSFNFPYNNKIILLVFWSSNVQNSKENLFKYSKLNSRYNSIQYKNCEGFQTVSIALQSDRILWEQDIKKYNLLKIINCIALKGYKDYFVKSYHLKETPTSFLIDEFGKIIYINPNIQTIMEYLDIRKNVLNNNETQNSIGGKIVIGDEGKPLKNSNLYILNNNQDTIKTILTNDNGVFYLKNTNSAQNITIHIYKNEQILEDEIVYIASENGEILTQLKKTNENFEYKLQEFEMVFLKSNLPQEPEVKQLKDLNFTENLFKNGGFDLSNDAKTKLDVLLNKLKKYPNAQIKITTYTDCNGDFKQNDIISLKRSSSICNYFISKGVKKERIKFFGKGEQEPLNKCIDGVICSEKENEINRRTVIVFYL